MRNMIDFIFYRTISLTGLNYPYGFYWRVGAQITTDNKLTTSIYAAVRTSSNTVQGSGSGTITKIEQYYSEGTVSETVTETLFINQVKVYIFDLNTGD